MNGERRDRAAAGRHDRELRSMNDIASGVHVANRRVKVLIGDHAPDRVAFTTELCAEVVGRRLSDREKDPVTVEAHPPFEFKRMDFTLR